LDCLSCVCWNRLLPRDGVRGVDAFAVPAICNQKG
jgi:hypothetical protein